MSRGVVLWPDARTSAEIRGVWDALDAERLPSMATHTHRLHQPHCSLVVAEGLDPEDALGAIGGVPSRGIPFRIGSVCVFPPSRALFLACVANRSLLDEQRRVHAATTPLVVEPWPYFEPDGWVPHITVSWTLSLGELGTAIPLILDRLPITGTFDCGGVEDGTSGETWAAARPR